MFPAGKRINGGDVCEVVFTPGARVNSGEVCEVTFTLGSVNGC